MIKLKCSDFRGGVGKMHIIDDFIETECDHFDAESKVTAENVHKAREWLEKYFPLKKEPKVYHAANCEEVVLGKYYEYYYPFYKTWVKDKLIRRDDFHGSPYFFEKESKQKSYSLIRECEQPEEKVREVAIEEIILKVKENVNLEFYTSRSGEKCATIKYSDKFQSVFVPLGGVNNLCHQLFGEEVVVKD